MALDSSWIEGDCLTTPPTSSADQPASEATKPKTSLSARVQEKLAADLPYGVVVAAAWSWRMLIIIMSAVAIWLLSHISLLIIPVLVAALLATLLQPAHRFFLKLKVPAVLSSLLLTAALITVVAALLTLAGQQMAVGFATIQVSV